MDQKLLDAIEQLKRGEERGFNYIYSTTCRLVYFQASTYLKNNADVEDLVQAVYIAVYQSIGTLNDPNAFYGWLKMIVRNQAGSMLRKFKDDVSLEEGMEEYQGVAWEETTDINVMPETAAEQKAVSEMVANIIEELPDPYKSVVTMSVYENMTMEEIAGVLDCPVGTVKTWNRKAKEMMKSKVEAIEKKDGVRLHALSIPTILLAFKLLSEREPMKAKAAESVLSEIKRAVNPIASATEIVSESVGAVSELASGAATVAQTVAVPAAKSVGLGAKIAGLSMKAKAIAAVGTLVVGGVTAVAVPKVMDIVSNRQVEASVTPGLSQESSDESVATTAPEPTLTQAPESTPTFTPTPEVKPYVMTEEEQKTLENLRYSIEDGEVTILGLIKDSQLEELVIPEQIEGCPVTKIAKSAFTGNSVIKTVKMPDSIIEVGESTFRSCSSLETIKLSDSLKTIPKDLCYRCNNLKEIEFPQALETIEWGAFADNEKLERVVLKSAKTIGDKAFYRCDGLREVVFPDNLEAIGENAFADCESLKEVVFQNGLKTIGIYAFGGCDALKTVEMPNSVVEVGESTFRSCSSLEMIKLSDSLKTIPQDLCYRCENLKEVEFPQALETIEWGAFAENDKLERVVLKSAKTIGDKAFFRCYALREVVFPDNLEAIGENAFAACESLKEVILPDSLKTLGKEAFSYCGSITHIEISNGLKELPDAAFFLCSSLEEIVIPGNIEIIGSSVFGRNKMLKDVEMQEGVRTIGSFAFQRCESLETISFPDTVMVFEECVFDRCYNLKKVNIPPEVQTLPKGMFNECSALEEFVLPETVTRIEESAFYCYYEGMKAIHLHGKLDYIADNAFTKVFGKVPFMSVERGSYAEKWAVEHGYISEQRMLEEEPVFTYVVTDGKAVITGCDKQKWDFLQIPAEVDGYPVVKIADSAFSGCEFTSVEIPETVETIGDNAFYTSNRLEAIRILADTINFNGMPFNATLLGLGKTILLAEEGTQVDEWMHSHY